MRKSVFFFGRIILGLVLLKYVPAIFSIVFNAECRFLAPGGCDEPQDTIFAILGLFSFSIFVFFFVPIVVVSFYLSLRILKKSNNPRVWLYGSILNLISLILFLFTINF